MRAKCKVKRNLKVKIIFHPYGVKNNESNIKLNFNNYQLLLHLWSFPTRPNRKYVYFSKYSVT